MTHFLVFIPVSYRTNKHYKEQTKKHLFWGTLVCNQVKKIYLSLLAVLDTRQLY